MTTGFMDGPQSPIYDNAPALVHGELTQKHGSRHSTDFHQSQQSQPEMLPASTPPLAHDGKTR